METMTKLLRQGFETPHLLPTKARLTMFFSVLRASLLSVGNTLESWGWQDCGRRISAEPKKSALRFSSRWSYTLKISGNNNNSFNISI